jgi:predicted TPR repeat methyltransferase
VAFAADILKTALAAGPHNRTGLYIGCGNGRNFIPLVAGGLDLLGLDLSTAAIAQLAADKIVPPERLLHGTLDDLSAGATFGLVIAIQVLQHGNRQAAFAHFRKALACVAPGGLFCLRVNSAATDVHFAHEVTERGADGGFTIRYLAGPKRGLDIHFFSRSEIAALLGPDFATVLPLRSVAEGRLPPASGHWTQWEGIWRRSAPAYTPR